MFRSSLALFFAFCSLLSMAQNQTNNWYFGNMAGLDFSTNPPTPLSNGAMNVAEGCSGISDAAGNLLFYTNGITVYTSAHTVMANGTNLLGDGTPVQGNIIVQNPGNTNEYFIFTVQGNLGSAGFRYSTVDMSLAAGMGSVTAKNVVLYSGICTEYIAATRHCNKDEFWVTAHEYGSAVFRSHHVSATGVNPVAVTSTVGTAHSGSVNPGSMKFNPQGSKLGITLPTNMPAQPSFELYDFDRSTGLLSNPLVLSTNYPVPYSCEFSQDGTKFYGSQVSPVQTGMNLIVQWDLCAGNNAAIVASETVIASNTVAPAGMQLASNGKIYVSIAGSQSLAVINNPDLAGVACNFVNYAQNISPGICNFGLPNFASHYLASPSSTTFLTNENCNAVNFTAPPLASSACQGMPGQVSSLVWDFGDPASGTSNTSTLALTTHSYASPGTYTVQLIMSGPCVQDTIKKMITVSSIAPAISVTTKNICFGESLNLAANGANTYSWSTGSTGASILVSPVVTSTYAVTGTNTATGCSSSKVVTVGVLECTGLSNVSMLDRMEFYPNPVINRLMVRSSVSANLDLYSIEGRRLAVLTIGQGENEIDLEFLEPGIYFLWSMEGGEERSKKLIKLEN